MLHSKGTPLQRVLVVSEDFIRRGTWAAWLRMEGLDTATCPGPHVMTRCPRLHGEPCSLREWSEVAVVEIGARRDEFYVGRPELSCTKLPDDSLTMFVSEERLGPQLEERRILGDPVTRETLVGAVLTASGS